MNLDGFEKIADYAWLKKGRKYWNMWAGNPFCVSMYKFPLSGMDKETIIELAKGGQSEEKERFTKRFPDTKWEG